MALFDFINSGLNSDVTGLLTGNTDGSEGSTANKESDFSMSAFLGAIKHAGMARTNRFSVTFPLPNGLGSIGSDAMQRIFLFCESTGLPSSSFATQHILTYGEGREMPYQRLYEPVNMTFYVDNGMTVKYLFDAWQNIICDPYSRNYGYYEDYTTDVKILVYDKGSNNMYLVTLKEAYPKTVSGVELSQDSTDVMTIDVLMQFKYWTISNVDYDANIIDTTSSNGFLNIYQAAFGELQSQYNSFYTEITSKLNSKISSKLGFADGSTGIVSGFFHKLGSDIRSYF